MILLQKINTNYLYLQTKPNLLNKNVFKALAENLQLIEQVKKFLLDLSAFSPKEKEELKINSSEVQKQSQLAKLKELQEEIQRWLKRFGLEIRLNIERGIILVRFLDKITQREVATIPLRILLERLNHYRQFLTKREDKLGLEERNLPI